MSPIKSDDQWRKLGKDDPYFGVVSMDKFRGRSLSADLLDEFFKSGDDHAAWVFQMLSEMLGRPLQPKRAYDFGCGVGRCAIPIASRSESAVGTDVSDDMLAEARLNCERLKVTNLELKNVGSDLTTLEGPFDFIHSFIVFQHIHPSRGLPIVKQMLERLEQGGCGCLQFVYSRDASALVRLAGWLRKMVPGLHGVINLMHGKRFSEGLMEKNCYPLDELMRLFQESGCGQVKVCFDGEGKLRSVILFFVKEPMPVPYDAFYQSA